MARREQRERADTEALHHLSQAQLPLPAGLEIEWLGTAGYRLTYRGQTLLIDPYLTRVPLRAVFSRQASRPTFRTSGLSELVSFLEYVNVFDWHSRLVKGATDGHAA